LPVWREQTQRLPPLAPPGVRYFAALDDDMVDRVFREEAADRQAGVTSPDYDRREVFDGEPRRRGADTR
jgi:hypothetical protein